MAATVQDATGSAPALYRPPYGVFFSSQGSWRRTAAALPAILDAVHAAGPHTVTA